MTDAAATVWYGAVAATVAEAKSLIEPSTTPEEWHGAAEDWRVLGSSEELRAPAPAAAEGATSNPKSKTGAGSTATPRQPAQARPP